MDKCKFLLAFSWVYIHCVLLLAPPPPFRWRGNVLLVLVQWARPRIRQVELQGEFCNTWPVSLSHLCGWRKRGKEEEEGRERGRRGQSVGVVGEQKWLGVMGGKSDNEKWSRERERVNNSWGSRREEKWDDNAVIFLLFFLPQSLSLHLFLSPIPPSLSFIRQPLGRAWLSRPISHYSPFQP